jgi:hypothetical protein
MAYKSIETCFEMLRNFLATGNSALIGTERKTMCTSLNEMLPYMTASSTGPGFVELATTAEAKALSSVELAITPANLGNVLWALESVGFAGVAAAGPCTATGVNVGDQILAVSSVDDIGLVADKFESIVTVNDQIQQVAVANLSANKYTALIYRPAITASASPSASLSPSASVSPSLSPSASVSPSLSPSASVSPSSSVSPSPSA